MFKVQFVPFPVWFYQFITSYRMFTIDIKRTVVTLCAHFRFIVALIMLFKDKHF